MHVTTYTGSGLVRVGFEKSAPSSSRSSSAGLATLTISIFCGICGLSYNSSSDSGSWKEINTWDIVMSWDKVGGKNTVCG